MGLRVPMRHVLWLWCCSLIDLHVCGQVAACSCGVVRYWSNSSWLTLEPYVYAVWNKHVCSCHACSWFRLHAWCRTCVCMFMPCHIHAMHIRTHFGLRFWSLIELAWKRLQFPYECVLRVLVLFVHWSVGEALHSGKRRYRYLLLTACYIFFDWRYT